MVTYTAGKLWGKAFIKGSKIRKAWKGGKLLYQAAAVSLVNMIPNGSFETDTSGWTISITSGNGSFTRVALPAANSNITYTPNAYCLQSSTTSFNGALATITINPALTVVSGNKYYIRFYYRNATKGTTAIVIGNNNATALTAIASSGTFNNTGLNGTGVWTLCDGIWQANTTSLTLRFNFTTANGNNSKDMCIDNVVVLNLTSIFGSGVEPAYATCRNMFSSLGGYFDGTVLY